jgi:uncharacterized protein (DUF433 family)
MSAPSNNYKYLVRKPKSSYEQLFVKDRWVAARTVYGMFARDEDRMTVEEIAKDYDIPVEAVLEAIAYCQSNPPELARDYAREEARVKASGRDQPDYYKRQPRPLDSEEQARHGRP